MVYIALLFIEKYVLYMSMPGNSLRNSINKNVWDFTKLIKWIMLFRSFIFLLCNKPIIKGEILIEY